MIASETKQHFSGSSQLRVKAEMSQELLFHDPLPFILSDHLCVCCEAVFFYLQGLDKVFAKGHVVQYFIHFGPTLFCQVEQVGCHFSVVAIFRKLPHPFQVGVVGIQRGQFRDRQLRLCLLYVATPNDILVWSSKCTDIAYFSFGQSPMTSGPFPTGANSSWWAAQGLTSAAICRYPCFHITGQSIVRSFGISLSPCTSPNKKKSFLLASSRRNFSPSVSRSC